MAATSPWCLLGSPSVGMRKAAGSVVVCVVSACVFVCLFACGGCQRWWSSLLVLRLCVLVCGGALRLASFRLSSLRISSPLISSPATVVTFAANYIRRIRLLTRITYAACTGRHQTLILERVRQASFVTTMRFHSATCELELDHRHDATGSC